MKTETEMELWRIYQILKTLTPDERVEFFQLSSRGYCEHCGCEDPEYKCQCWNDE